MKPILFNTDMVRAILDGRKTVTRRVIKPRYRNDESGFQVCTHVASGERFVEKIDENECGIFADGSDRRVKPPYKVGDILYVRETFRIKSVFSGSYYGSEIEYKTGDIQVIDEIIKMPKKQWTPSIHMPKEAARILLKVTDVRVERLQDMDAEDALKEGCGECSEEEFAQLWNSTIKKIDIDDFGWNANPWVWVIEFERCEKPESEGE